MSQDQAMQYACGAGMAFTGFMLLLVHAVLPPIGFYIGAAASVASGAIYVARGLLRMPPFGAPKTESDQ